MERLVSEWRWRKESEREIERERERERERGATKGAKESHVHYIFSTIHTLPCPLHFTKCKCRRMKSKNIERARLLMHRIDREDEAR
jgi:hypothetical protein